MLHRDQNKKAQNRAPQVLSALAIALYSSGAIAADDNSIYKFDGFATVGLVHSSEKHADFAAVITRPSGAGFSRNWSPDVDSKIGGQISANFDSWSAVLQVISEQNWDNSYLPHIEWANVKYAFSPDFSVRVGRTTIPVYLFSDSRKVGYSIPWVRTATYFYSMAPMSTNDGIDTSYRFRVGTVSNTITGQAGKGPDFKLADRTPEGNKVTMHSLLALTDKVEIGDLTLQFSLLRGRTSLSKIVAIPVPELAQLGNHVTYLNKIIGFNYDPGNYYVLGEAAQDSSPFLGARRGAYISGGYRIGKFSPYVMYETNKQTKPSPGFIPVSDLAASSIGVRWDVMKNVDLKLQYDHISLGKGAAGPLVNPQPGFVPGGKVNLVSFVADFLF